MHGIINRAFELMMIQKFGEVFWRRVKEEAGLRLVGEFLFTEFYSDESTYKLIGAVEKLTGVTKDTILECYGEYFYDYLVEFGYIQMLKVLGKNPADFLMNLDTMHLALARVYPPLTPPLYKCENLPNGDLVLYYFSKRPNLEAIVVGLMRKAIMELFGIAVEVTMLEKSFEMGSHQCKLLVHPTDKDDTLSGPATVPDEPLVESLIPNRQIISPETFANLLPFHILFERNLHVKQCGAGLLRTLQLFTSNFQLDQYARITRPNIPLSFEAIQEHLNSIFLVTVTSLNGPLFRLNGQMIYLKEEDQMLYIGSPYIVDLDDLYQKGFHVADFSLHDAKRDFILAAEIFEEERVSFKKLENLTTKMQETSIALSLEKAKTDRLLFDVLPPPVARELKLGNPVLPQRFESVTILFSRIVEFETFSEQYSDAMDAGLEVVALLNKLYTTLDSLLDPNRNPEIYKAYGHIETIHDKYMCVSGAPDTTLYHAKHAARLALDMMDNVRNVSMAGTSVRLTIGINSGEVVAGVIGQRMPRYCLFGDSVNRASRIMIQGKAGRITMSHNTFRLLQTGYNYDREFVFERSSDVTMKNSKIPVKTFLLSRSRRSDRLPKTLSRICEIV